MFAQTADEDQLFYLLFPDLPGGAEAFELVAKFCYGLDPSISVYNVAMIRCAAHYLEMDECGLDTLAQAYFNQLVLPNPANAIAVLRTCDTLLPLADELQIVNKCIEKIVSAACSELMSIGWDSEEQKGIEESWVQKFAQVRMDFFQRIVSGMKSKGMQEDIISGALMHYAHNSLDGLSQKRRQQRTAITVDASAQCRMELESRLAMSLDRATSHDLLVLSFSHTGEALFDVEIVQRVVTNFLAFTLDESASLYGSDEAEEMGMYYNSNGIAMEKAHPSATDGERNKLCKLMDCQKLSADACMHAAKNQRLPLHVVVQVLYFEQLRLRDEMQSGSIKRSRNRCETFAGDEQGIFECDELVKGWV
ncbi:hypothetical protein KI387_003687 [Taxus chinensis]|uniref:NPH3 domain-containing protein n=1 Tax=Taxus chinensis TaxID=29808 RepID=A0AA38LPW8_TAXCH|nr:hypothetical protein KI387_003687 [Taxus chinensis]